MDKKLDAQISKYLEENKENFIKDLRKLLSFNSVNAEPVADKPFGEEVAKALDFMIGLCADAGLETENFDYYCMEAKYGNHKESIGTLCHLDIVPAGDGWGYSPFEGKMDGDIMYARGVCDDKGPAIAILYAMKALMDAGVKMNKTIKLIFGCDEETGMTDMKYYLTKREAPTYSFSPDAEFPVIFAEKNIIHGSYKAEINGKTNLISLNGGTATNAVPNQASAQIKYDKKPEDTEMVSYSLDNGVLTIAAKGIATHASLPHTGDNAISRLLGVVCDLLADDDAAKTLVQAMFDKLSSYDGSGMGIDCEDEPTGALTLNHGVIKLEDNVIYSYFDIRHPVTLNHKALLETLKTSLPGFELQDGYASAGIYHEKDGFLVSTLQGLYREISGDNESEPVSMGGGTYARCLPNAVAFGPKFPDGNAGGAHTVGEYADINELLKAARLYAHCLYSLAQ